MISYQAHGSQGVLITNKIESPHTNFPSYNIVLSVLLENNLKCTIFQSCTLCGV